MIKFHHLQLHCNLEDRVWEVIFEDEVIASSIDLGEVMINMISETTSEYSRRNLLAASDKVIREVQRQKLPLTF